MKVARAERREIAFALLALENLIGEAEIGSHELVRQNLAGRSIGEQSVQAERAAEDRFVIGDAPFAELSLDARGRILNQQPGKALKTNAWGQGSLIPVGKFKRLLNPARQVLSDVEEHAKLGIASVQQRAVQIVPRRFSLWQKALQL